MMKSVRNSASPINAEFGGVSCMPMAWRNIDSTMMVRRKEVTHTRSAGRMASTVSPSTTRSAWAVSVDGVAPIAAACAACAHAAGVAAQSPDNPIVTDRMMRLALMSLRARRHRRRQPGPMRAAQVDAQSP